MQKVVLATGNAGKVCEFSELLKECNLNIIAQTELAIRAIEETGLTFIENAILKARNAAKVSGLAAIADDSGLSVNALNGAPGIYSARFAGENASDEENLHKLLSVMKDIPDNQRQAQFNCVLVYLRHFADPTPIICHCIWQGVLTHEPKGSNGFGYDPIFYDTQLKLTAAQLTKAQKNALSHRGQALRMLLGSLTNA
ncbi:RdgB/HAM1 family non-canonical purine NTP pyrophosphatase [Arsenophonus nasoniae]|uniref:dITP/XTP pyrophosphatase n=1 Tax=Arsenophonus nasoniae TaxID=638 RepID=A0AA95GHP8_9GAMM|nr:RdgB/HAM1 family non-canonical purine NTP pyrophosphatase [Arsenophonus nasoniae]WGL96973.1 RdgB/HAM1 family non-canonical purine NTP pyrophosphatase [Arsenophonus nasoniae]